MKFKSSSLKSSLVFILCTCNSFACDDDDKPSRRNRSNDDVMTTILPSKDLNVNDSNTRACDLLLELDNTTIRDVEFTDEVIGVFKTRYPKVSISFTYSTDEPLKGGIANLNLTSGNINNINLVESKCYNHLGELTANETPIELGISQ